MAADDDLLVARLAADLSSATRVDLSWCDAQGVEQLRMTDIPVRGDGGSVICQQSITFAKASPSNTLIAQAASAQGVLDGPAVAGAAQMVSDTSLSILTGRQLGAYQLEALLGRGGMGGVTSGCS